MEKELKKKKRGNYLFGNDCELPYLKNIRIVKMSGFPCTHT